MGFIGSYVIFLCYICTISFTTHPIIMSIRGQVKGLYNGVLRLPSALSDWVVLSGSDRAASAFMKRFPQPELTAADKRAIDEFWRPYGVGFRDYRWHQMYYGVTGLHDPSFVPDPIARFALFRHYNDEKSIPGWDDKNLYEFFLPDIRFPKTLAHIYHNGIYDKDWKHYSQDELPSFSKAIYDELGEDKSLVIKVTKGSYAGKGVRLIHAKSPDDIKDLLLESIGGNFIVQERIFQSDFMSQFCKTSVNIFRIITWKHEGEVKVLSSSIRFGLEGYFTDVCYIDGEEIVNVVGVEKDGTVKEQYGSFRGLTDISVDLHERVSPRFDDIIAIAKQGHERLHPFGIVGWDFTLNQENEPICIEFNVSVPGTILYQYANGPFGGDHTEELLAFLLDKNNTKKYIPKRYRIK